MGMKQNPNDPKTVEKQTVPKSKTSRIKAWIRSAFFAALCLAVVVGNFYWEQSTKSRVGKISNEIEFTEDGVDIFGLAYIDGGIEEADLWRDEDAGEYVFQLGEGKFWGNLDSFGDLGKNINIQIEGENTGKVVLIPYFADFVLDYTDGVVELDTYVGTVYVGFLKEGIKETGYKDEYNSVFENVLLVPEGVGVKIPLSKIDERLNQLLPSKLAKEFSYGFISAADYEDEFVKENLTESIGFSESLENLKRDEFAKISRGDVSFSSSVFDWLSRNLAVFEYGKEGYYEGKLDQYVVDALLAEDSDEAQFALSNFRNMKMDLPQYDKFVAKWLSDLAVFDADDPEAEVLDFLIKEAGGSFSELDLLALRLGMYAGAEDVGVAFEAVYGAVKNQFGSMDDGAVYKKFLAYYGQIFNNYLLRFPELYKLGYFEMKSEVEDELFELYYGGQLKEELKQSFVSQKIKLLKRMKYFLFGEKIKLDDAKKVMRHLVEGIDNYMPAKTSQNAVIALFERELEDIGSFWGYINNAEYSKSSLYGGNHKERYAVYLEEKDRVTSILDVQRDILGSDIIADVTVEDVVNEIGEIFESAGAQGVEIGEMDDVHQRFVKIAAVLGGYAFDAEYDREYGYVRNIHAYGDQLTLNNMKLESLEDFLAKNLKDVVEEAEISEDDDTETNAQKIAKAIIAKEVVESGFVASMNDVDIIDTVNAIYRLNDVEVQGEVGLLVSFDYRANDGTVTKIFVVRDGEGGSMTGEFPLSDLKDIVASEHY